MTAARSLPLQTATALIAAGTNRARDNGASNPDPDAVTWELLMEAADTLKRLPDREKGWLTMCDRAAWPTVLQEQGDRWAAAVANGRWNAMRVRPGPPAAAAIERMDTLFRLAARFPRPLDLRRAFLLASGVPAATIARQTQCSRQTVYNARDRAVTLLAQRLYGLPEKNFSD